MLSPKSRLIFVSENWDYIIFREPHTNSWNNVLLLSHNIHVFTHSVPLFSDLYVWATIHRVAKSRMRLEQLSTWVRSSRKTLKIHIWNSSHYPWSHCHFRDSVKINRHLKKLVIEHDHSSKPRDKIVWEMYFRNSLEIWKSLILFLQIMRIHKFHSRINALNFFTRLELFTMYLNLAITAILL